MPDKHNKVDHAVPQIYRDENLELTIDSNVIWALLSYCSLKKANIDAFLCIL